MRVKDQSSASYLLDYTLGQSGSQKVEADGTHHICKYNARLVKENNPEFENLEQKMTIKIVHPIFC